MSDDNSASATGSGERQPVDGWLQPLGDPPCGDDLEYDPQFLELTQAAAGKPETQFSAAEPPAWPEVLALSEGLLARTRDLRVAVLWARASVSMNGLVAVPESLRLIRGLLDNFWDHLHPALDPDDGDSFARISTTGTLADTDGLFGDVRQGQLLADRRLAGLRTRDVEVALDRLPPRSGDEVHSTGFIQGLLTDAPDACHRVRAAVTESLAQLKELQRLMNDRFGVERSVDVKPLRGLLDAVASVLPPEEGAAESPASDGGGESSAPMARAGRRTGPGTIETREDAVKAINLICDFLERTEPTNPAQFLLRRAERLISKNFLQLVRDLAPDAMAEVARIMGVDPDSISSDD